MASAATIKLDHLLDIDQDQNQAHHRVLNLFLSSKQQFITIRIRIKNIAKVTDLKVIK